MKNSLAICINDNKTILNILNQKSLIETKEFFSIHDLNNNNFNEIKDYIDSLGYKLDSKVNLFIVDKNQYNHGIDFPKTSKFNLNSQIFKEIKTRFNKPDFYLSLRIFDLKKKGLYIFSTFIEPNLIDKISDIVIKLNLKIEYIFSVREIIEIKAYQNNYPNGVIVVEYFNNFLLGIVKDYQTISYEIIPNESEIQSSILRQTARYQYRLFGETISSILINDDSFIKDLTIIKANEKSIFEVPKQMKRIFYKRIK